MTGDAQRERIELLADVDFSEITTNLIWMESRNQSIESQVKTLKLLKENSIILALLSYTIRFTSFDQ